jgi:hypothetical protein
MEGEGRRSAGRECMVGGRTVKSGGMTGDGRQSEGRE